MDAFSLGFANKLEGSDCKAVKSLAKLQLPQNKKKANQIREKITNTNELIIGSRYVLNADMDGVFYGITKDHKTIENKEINDVIISSNREMGVTNDEFEVVATYYENSPTVGPDTAERTDVGEKVASHIVFTEGAHKGNRAVIFHTDDIEGSKEIITNISIIK
jgi:hypothetical protein